MALEKPNPIIRVFPSLTDAAFILPLFFLFGKLDGASGILEGDTGWHIRTGQWILANGHVPHSDIFSYTKAGQSWFAWEWLWDIGAAWLYNHWGMPAVVAASILLICLSFTLLLGLVRRTCNNAFLTIAATLVATAGSSMHWWARPHLFTLFFVVIFLWILERAREGAVRPLVWLPIITAFWTNLHGGFMAGLIILGIYAAGELVTWLVETDPGKRQAALALGKRLVFTGIFCGVATFINPYFYQLHVHIYENLSADFFYKYISEWQSINFQMGAALYLEPMLWLGAVAGLWCIYKKQFVYPILLASWGHMALYSARNVPIYLIVSAPIVARTCEELLSLVRREADVAGWVRQCLAKFEDVGREFDEMDRIPRVHLVSAAAAALMILVMATPAPPKKFLADYDPKKYPARAVDQLLKYPAGDRIFTHDEWGDYLIYRLYPADKVFVDGRFDFYGAKFTENYLELMNARYDWQKKLDKYEVNTVLLPTDAAFASVLKESRRWKPVYDDGMAIIFRSVSNANRVSIVSTSNGSTRGREIAKALVFDREIEKP